MKALIPLILLLLLSQSFAQFSSPEPEMDPLIGKEQMLFITPAGRNPTPMKPLTPRTKNVICPDDYPRGFNVRCIANPVPRKVVFRLNGMRYRTEKREPFYLAGDYGGFVKRFETTKSFAVGCMIRRRNVWAVVRLKC